MNYTNDKEQIVFLRDADIASSLNGKAISSDQPITTNGIPSFDLFKNKYEELSTYDNNICAYIKDGVEVSVQNLCLEIANLRNEADALSTNICVSVDYISGFVRNTISADLYQLSSGTKETSTLLSNQITALWEDVRGGINYKGHLSANYTTTFPDGTPYDISTLFASYYHLLDDDTKQLTADKKLNNGWLYNFTTTDLSGYKTKDGTLLENNDYLIIHSHSASCINISEMSRNDVDIIEAIQDDYVRFALLKQISDYLSTDYIGKIGTLSTALSGDIDSLSNALCADIKSLSTALSTDIKTLSTELSNRIDDLSDSISGTVELSVKNLQNQVISNDNDIEFLSNSISVEVKRNLDSVHYKKDLVIDSADHTLLATFGRTCGWESHFRVGYMFRFPTAHTLSNSEPATWSYDFEENDYVIFRKEVDLSALDETCFDIIKDYDEEIKRSYNNLTSQINQTSVFLSNDILSGDKDYSGENWYSGKTVFNASVDINAPLDVNSMALMHDGLTSYGGITMECNPNLGMLGGRTISITQLNITNTDAYGDKTYDYPIRSGTLAITQDVIDLSTALSTDVSDLELSVNGISTIVNTLSSNLSTDIDTKYDDLTTQISATSSYISGEVAKNDVDIANIQGYISGDNSLCTELSTLQNHYYKTFIEDTYDKGPDKKVDVLKVVNSEDTNNKFKLIYLSGTIVLETL